MTRRRRDRPPPPQAQPLGGLIVGHDGRGVIEAGAQVAVLVVGPPRVGKTACLMIPNTLYAAGAVVSTSTKPDVLAATARARARRGQVWVFDPTGTLSPIPGVRPARWSPVAGCENWATAVTTARLLARSAQPGRGVADASHWVERAEALLAPLLHAAARLGIGIEWVCRWVARRDLTEPLQICGARGDAWAADVLTGIANTEERERSGILSTAAGILAAYRMPAALAAAANPDFDPDAFANSGDTLYICAPAEHQDLCAPIVVAILDRIRAATYRRGPAWPPVTWVLDEAANIAPIPDLPAIVSEGGSQGLAVIAAVQDLSQARSRWRDRADGFFTLFGAKVILPGVADRATLELVSALAGQVQVWVPSRNRSPGVLGGWQDGWSSQLRPRLPVEAISAGQPGYGLLIDRHHGITWSPLAPWWVSPVWWATATGP